MDASKAGQLCRESFRSRKINLPVSIREISKKESHFSQKIERETSDNHRLPAPI